MCGITADAILPSGQEIDDARLLSNEIHLSYNIRTDRLNTYSFSYILIPLLKVISKFRKHLNQADLKRDNLYEKFSWF